MKLLKAILPTKIWGSLSTKFPASSTLVGDDEFTEGSQNIVTEDRGVITKRKGSVDFNPTSFGTAPADQYEAIFSDGAHHLLVMSGGQLKYSPGTAAFTDVSGAAYSPAGNMEFASYLDRVYFSNGIDSPQVYDRTLSYGGVGYSAPKVKDMGAQAPTSALSAAVGAAGNVPAGSYLYKVTFLYYDFEESNGGTASSAVNPGVSSQINLTSIPIGGYGVTARKIYRSGDGGATYRLVQTINNNTATTGTDNASVGTAFIPEDNGLPPNFSLIVQHKDRIWVAGVSGDPSQLYFSAAGLPDIFPGLYQLTCNPNDPITALAVYNDRIVVLNRHSFGQILGTTPDNFFYSQIPGSVGCVDNRSIQVRTIEGVPSLIWLSDSGFYSFNGSTVNHISDKVENLVNLNIQQAAQVKGTNAQSTQSDFQGGTASGGIDLTTLPGSITSPNPTRSYQTQSAWEGGSVTNQIATRGTSNALKAPVKRVWTYTEGIDAEHHNGTIPIDGGNRVALPTIANFTGENTTFVIFRTFLDQLLGGPQRLATKITPLRSGTMTSIVVRLYPATTLPRLYEFSLRSDNSNEPGGQIGSSASVFITSATSQPVTIPVPSSWTVSSGNSYWIQVILPIDNQEVGHATGNLSGGASKMYQGGAWITMANPSGSVYWNVSYNFTMNPLNASGEWTSAIYDSLQFPNAGAENMSISHSSSIAGGQSVTTFVDRSDNSDMSSADTYTVASLNGTSPFSASSTKRYWRVRVRLSTTDNRATPTVGKPTLTFEDKKAIWVSQAVDCTTDVTAYSSLVTSSTVPAGTAVTTEVATSPDNITYTAYGPVGGATVQRYVKIRLTLDTTSDNLTSPTVTSVVFDWTTTANLISSAIDMANPPGGWNIFQSDYDTNGGTLTFELRSASTIGGLSGATFYTVTNGAYPTASLPTERYVQWRATLIATPNAVPIVDSVTVNWFIQIIAAVRVASLFYDKTYYLAGAEFGQTTNNVVFAFDSSDNWRIYRGISPATMSLFFNSPFFGSSTTGKIIRFLEGTSDNGAAITLDVRTKAFDFQDISKIKALRKVFVVGKNTGAILSVQYSTDGGATFLPLLDSAGASSFTTTAGGDVFIKRLVPQWPSNLSGQTLMFRVYNSDTNEVELHELILHVFTREGEALSA